MPFINLYQESYELEAGIGLLLGLDMAEHILSRERCPNGCDVAFSRANILVKKCWGDCVSVRVSIVAMKHPDQKARHKSELQAPNLESPKD